MSHGATVGQLGQDALMYLRQRGIDAREAKLMLMFALLMILAKSKYSTLRERIANLLDSRLVENFHSATIVYLIVNQEVRSLAFQNHK